MKSVFSVCIILTVIIFSFIANAALAFDPPDPRTYMLRLVDLENAKKILDDPASTIEAYPVKKVIPKALYEKLVFPVDQMKKEWADVIGFSALDVVGKKAPEVKPGKYTYKDVETNPEFKKLFWGEMLERIKPGGPPFVGNIPEFEIVPTQQYYHSLPVAEYTRKNAAKVKTDENGYLIPTSWEGGYPFPKPSGKFKGLQIMFNVEKRYLSWDGSFVHFTRMTGYRKDLSRDFLGSNMVQHLKLAGRLAIEPFGWLDERAEKRGEMKTFVLNFTGPRDSVGTAMSALYYIDPNKADLLMVYVPQLRRIRMLTSSDSQDPIQGQDLIYDDNEGFLQKLSPTQFPYDWKVLEETEYLAPVVDGKEYFTSDGLALMNLKFMRRPIYVIEGTQLDKNYVYSKRIFYIDQENFNFYMILNYDQKDRLYRSFFNSYIFEPEMGVFHLGGSFGVMRDHVDVHSGYVLAYQLPAFWTRKDVSLEGYMFQK